MEPTYSPSIAGTPAVGVELQLADLTQIAQVAGLADDHVLAELLRLIPTDGTTVHRGILPFAMSGGPSPVDLATVWPDAADVSQPLTGGVPDSGVLHLAINPFRAIIGTRTAFGTDSLANWRDIRTAVCTGRQLVTVNFVPAASGNAWALVYAVVSVDQASTPSTLRVKSPVDGSLSTPSVSKQVVTTVTVGVKQGAASTGTPALPTIDADGGGNYYIPLAYVLVKGGAYYFVGDNIRDIAPVISLAASMGAPTVAPANGNNDGGGAYAANSPWQPGAAHARPGIFLPPSMVGGVQRIIELDASTSSPSPPSGNVVDSSVDWRMRFFLVFAQVHPSPVQFANDPTSGTVRAPVATANTAFTPVPPFVGMQHSFVNSAIPPVSGASLFFLDNAACTFIAAGTNIQLVVDMTDGTMKVYYSGVPGVVVFVWVMATGQFPNL